MTKTHVSADLLAYLDDGLTAAERARVEAHLATCAACREELASLRALRAGLAVAFDAALTPVRLPRAAEERIRGVLRERAARPRWWWTLRLNWGLAAQAALALLVLLFSLNLAPLLTAPPPVAAQETLVLGQNRLAPGSAAALRVIVRDRATATPVPGAEIAVSIGKAPGLAREVYRGVTDATGAAAVAFTVPADLEGAAELRIETTSTAGSETLVHPITVARAFRVLLMPDKPAYRPGQPLHLRALALDAVTLRPADDATVTFSIHDAAGRQIAHETRRASEFGVAFADVTLPETAVSGAYTLRAAVGDTLAERAVFVDDYTLPAFRLAITPERSFALSGDVVTGVVEAAAFYGAPLAGAQATVRGYTRDPRQLVAESAGMLDAAGRFTFSLTLPEAYGASALDVPVSFDIEAEVVSAAGEREGLRHTLAVAAQPLLIRAVPESGQLKPGVENTLYILVAYPDGTPAPATLRATLPSGAEARIETDAYGLAVLRFTPGAGLARLELVAEDGAGRVGRQRLALAAGAAAPVLLLRAERAAYQVGETLRLEALAAGVATDAPVYLDVLRANQTVATLSAPVQGGRAVFALDLDAALIGSLQLHAYALPAQGVTIEDTRWVVVEPAQALAVTVATDRERYAPGETARLAIETARESAPIEAALGISLVDASVYALETRGADFARLEALLAQELLAQTEDAAALEQAQQAAARAAWATAPKATYSLDARQVLRPRAAVPAPGWVNGVAVTLIALPALLGVMVVRGLAAPGADVLRGAWRRVRWGLLALMLAAPLWGALLAGSLWLLAQLAGVWGLLLMGAPVAGLLAALLFYSWQRRDARLQAVLGLVGAYLLLGLALTLALARGGALSGWLLAGAAAMFLLLLVGLALLGQGLLLAGRRGAGWATTALALCLIPLVMYLAFVPALASPLTRALGDPALYAGPVGWLTGCAAKAPIMAPTTETVQEAEVTVAPTLPAPEAPVTPEPFPLRQIFPETLYWNPEARTDAGGAFAWEIILPDKPAAWRGTVLASTLAGDIGAATFEVRVAPLEQP